MNRNRTLLILRWTARISAALTAAVTVLFFVGEGAGDGFGGFLHRSPRETALLAAFGAVWFGLLLGWRWEKAGGMLTLCGLAAFYLLHYLFSRTLPRGPFFLMYAFPALLFVYCGMQEGKAPETGKRSCS